MKKVYYRYGTRDVGCGCCHESDNVLEITEDGKTLYETDWLNPAPTFYDNEELRKWVTDVYEWPDDELEMHPDNEYL